MPDRRKRDRTSALSDLMFLLLLSVLAVFATQHAVSDAPNEGDVNPTRFVSIWRSPDTPITLTWQREKIAEDTRLRSGATDDGVMWFGIHDHNSPDPSHDRKLTIYFVGVAALRDPGVLEIESPSGCDVQWEPDVHGLAGRSDGPLTSMKLRVMPGHIEEVSTNGAGGGG